MTKDIVRNKKGRYVLFGIVFVVLGFVLENLKMEYSRFAFYISMYFLGFFATKEAIVDTLENKSPNVDLLMIIAALGSVLINYESEGAVLLLIFAGAEVLEEYVSKKSGNAIKELMNQVPDTAKLLREDGTIIEIDTNKLKLGDIVVVSKGDQLPIDGTTDRKVLINESSLTGESIPVTKDIGDEVFAGTINEGDSFHLEVNKLKEETVFSNIIKMVEQAQNNPSKREEFIEKIESKYVIGVLVSVPLFILGLYYFAGYSFSQAFYRGMVLLTVASPCALVASAKPATLSAISNAAKNGILFKDAKAFELLNNLSFIATDKTGTLTHGEFDVISFELDEEILKQVVYIEQNSNHPIAKSIVRRFENIDLSSVEKDKIEEIAGSGLKMGDIIVSKPSNFIGYNDKNNYLEKINSENTIALVAKGNTVVGYIELADTIRKSAKEAINKFHKNNILIEMLTGDNEKTANNVASQLGLEKYKANCFPEVKMKLIHEKQANNEIIAMIGDGINDAPALANADIGISMGSGSSIAMESSEMVIVKNDLNKLFHSFKLSQKLNKIIIQNIIFSICVIIVLIALNLLGYLDLPKGVVFHEGSTILVILNGLRLLYYKGENIE